MDGTKYLLEVYIASGLLAIAFILVLIFVKKD